MTEAAPARVTFVGDDRALSCQPGETLLRAGLRAGLGLSYECASGGCGSCRAQLVDGEVRSLWADAAGLTERDRKRGNRILMCQSVPEGNVAVKAPLAGTADGSTEPIPDRHPGLLLDRIGLTADTALFRIEFDEPVDYLAGQFMLLESPDGVRRAYSMAHPPAPGPADGDNVVEFVIREKPGGLGSNWLFSELSVGEPITAEGPYGRAYARPDQGRPVLCVAGGTGLGPILAICEQIVAENRPVPVHLYVGARRSADLVLLDRIEKLSEHGVAVSLSAQHAEESVDLRAGQDRLRIGTVVEHVAADWADLSGCDIYLAGPAGMVDAAMKTFVRGAGASADQLYFDRFTA